MNTLRGGYNFQDRPTTSGSGLRDSDFGVEVASLYTGFGVLRFRAWGFRVSGIGIGLGFRVYPGNQTWDGNS